MEVVLSVLGVLYVFRYVTLYTVARTIMIMARQTSVKCMLQLISRLTNLVWSLMFLLIHLSMLNPRVGGGGGGGGGQTQGNLTF